MYLMHALAGVLCVGCSAEAVAPLTQSDGSANANHSDDGPRGDAGPVQADATAGEMPDGSATFRSPPCALPGPGCVTCDDGIEIPADWVCDGIADCHSDETACLAKPPGSSPVPYRCGAECEPGLVCSGTSCREPACLHPAGDLASKCTEDAGADVRADCQVVCRCVHANDFHWEHECVGP